jgi:hypothetical protein
MKWITLGIVALVAVTMLSTSAAAQGTSVSGTSGTDVVGLLADGLANEPVPCNGTCVAPPEEPPGPVPETCEGEGGGTQIGGC